MRRSVAAAKKLLSQAEREQNNTDIAAEDVEVDTLTHEGPGAPEPLQLKQAHGHAQLQARIDERIFPHLFPDGTGGYDGKE
eukprot:4314010-Amphidinium_carterae.1